MNAELDKLVYQATHLEQFQRAGLDADGAGGRRRRVLLVDDSHRKSEARQFDRSRQARRSGADNQDREG